MHAHRCVVRYISDGVKDKKRKRKGEPAHSVYMCVCVIFNLRQEGWVIVRPYRSVPERHPMCLIGMAKRCIPLPYAHSLQYGHCKGRRFTALITIWARMDS